MDRTRLAEALRKGGSGTSVIGVLKDAAEAVLDAPTVQWCATHNREVAHAVMSDRCERITVALVPVEDN